MQLLASGSGTGTEDRGTWAVPAIAGTLAETDQTSAAILEHRRTNHVQLTYVRAAGIEQTHLKIRNIPVVGAPIRVALDQVDADASESCCGSGLERGSHCCR